MTNITVPEITLNSIISLRSLSNQLENGVAIVGYGNQFLELPSEGLHFIDWLNSGLTVAQARNRFQAEFNPFPDDEVMAVLDAFLECDFIATIDGQRLAPHHTPVQPSRALWVSSETAQAIFSTPAMVAWLLFCGPAAILWVATPQLWPRRADYFWTDYYFIILLVGVLVWLTTMAIHESAHWLACRAKGINATITWTQRLGFLPMSQTVMHDIWAVPRRERYLPLAAGILSDILRMSLVLYLLWFDQAGLWLLPSLLTKFLKYYLLVSTIGLTVQFWLFSKMDGYFLLSAFLGQRNLQADTYQWLKSSITRNNRFDPPAGGMKYIYMYALISLVWGGFIVGQFLLISLPIKLQLLWESLLKLMGTGNLSPLNFADGVAVLTSQAIYWGLLLYAHWRETLPQWRRK